MITLEEYQEAVNNTAIYPDRDENFVYPVLGLTGEAGEVAEKFKKVIRDKHSVIDVETRAEIIKELGDVCWYVAEIAGTHLGSSLEEVLHINRVKLADRLIRGALHGEGDER